MAETYDFPPDLIAAQKAFWEADARVWEVTDRLPSSLAIAPGKRRSHPNSTKNWTGCARLGWRP
ncbi:hypothetical protein [Streptosporangium jomthongense]|uniref:Uncharacterized protein n=1 Tax=Streptosporangium jomthongense TaxID=1193683 RepID=A0ABV8FCI0_9ACTN